MLGMSKDKLARRDGVLRTGVVWIGLFGLSMALMGLSCPGADTDGDGVVDTADLCAATAAGATVDADGCSTAQIDTDGDGTYDDVDGCINDPLKTAAGVCGCGVADTDTDADGVADCNDACEGYDDTADADADGTPDACDLEVSTSGVTTAIGGTTVSLTASASGGVAPITYSWAITTPLTTGSATIAPADGIGQVLSVTFSDDADGSMTLTATGTDANSLTDSATHSIAVTPNVAPTSLAFTLNTDNLTGTTGDDTFTAGLEWSAGLQQTLQAGDQANGNGGTDTLNVILNGTAVTPSLTAIAVINVTDNGPTALTLSAATGVTTINSLNSTAAPNILAVQNLVDLGITNSAVNMAVQFTGPAAAPALDSAADTMALSLSAVTGGILTINAGGTNISNIETLDISSGGAVANVLTGVVQAGVVTTLTTINIDGAQDLTVTNAIDASVTTVDASAATGGASILFTAGAAVTATGGAGDDRFAFAAGDLTTADTVSGGSAGTDTLALADLAIANGTDLATAVSGATGFDILEMTAIAAITNLDMNEIGAITDVLITGNGAAAVTINNQDNADTYTLKNADRSLVTVNDEVPGANVLNINQEDGDVLVALAAGDFETVNIDSGGNAPNEVTTLTAGVNATINVTGARAWTTTLGAAGNLVGSTATGILTINGSAGDDSIVTGSGVDVIDAGDGDDTITSGAGADTLVFASGDLSAAPGAAVYDQITDFGTASDIIDFGATALTIEAAAAAAVAGTAQINAEGICTFDPLDDTLGERLIAAEAGLAGGGVAAGAFCVFEQGGNSYVYISDAVAGIAVADHFLRLTGVTGLTNTTLTGGDLTIN